MYIIIIQLHVHDCMNYIVQVQVHVHVHIHVHVHVHVHYYNTITCTRLHELYCTSTSTSTSTCTCICIHVHVHLPNFSGFLSKYFLWPTGHSYDCFPQDLMYIYMYTYMYIHIYIYIFVSFASHLFQYATSQLQAFWNLTEPKCKKFPGTPPKSSVHHMIVSSPSLTKPPV